MITQQKYKDYNDYTAHQAHKLDVMKSADIGRRTLERYEQTYPIMLYLNLLNCPYIERGTAVLCLGARLGAEVRAFIEMGCFAVGIDLNPGPDNKHVLKGDFNVIQFPNGSVDVVYTNSIDHAYDIDLMISEIQRVLKKDGHLILHLVGDGLETKDEYETCQWDYTGEVIDRFREHGFKVRKFGDVNMNYFKKQVELVNV